MYLHALANAVPGHAYTQRECWDLLQSSGALGQLRERSALLLEKVLTGDSGIRKRHFAMPAVKGLFSLDAETLNRGFEREAPELAGTALREALDKAGLRAADLDALIICSCTGYICPGPSSHVAEKLGLRPDAYLQDIIGLGCGAAIPTLRSAAGFAAAHPGAKIACVAVEICSAAFYLDDDPGVLISLCLFGDGASASIWSGRPGPTGYRIEKFDTIHQPEHRELLRFTNTAGKLKNQLDRSVPGHAASAVARLRERAALGEDIRVASHSGGRDVLDALEAGLPPGRLGSARSVLHDFGNMSSPSVLFSLERELIPDSQTPVWMTSFGAGFSAHSCLLSPPAMNFM